MSGKAIELLAQQMEAAYQMLWTCLQGITEEEYFWEPVPECWTVFQRADGQWTYHYELPTPHPHPFTTLAWRINHLALCKIMYHEYAFGPAMLTWQTIATPSSMTEALALLERGQGLLRDDLSCLTDDADLEALRPTNWGEPWPTWRIFWTMIHHDAHHGGEIGCIRDLYRAGRSRLPLS